jgi:hypothetical protein
MSQRLSALKGNIVARLNGVKKETDGVREKPQSHSLMLCDKQVGAVRERSYGSEAAHRALGDLYGDITALLENTESPREVVPVFTEFELNLSAALESLWE